MSNNLFIPTSVTFYAFSYKKKHFFIILKVATKHLNVYFLVIFKLQQPGFLDLSNPGFGFQKSRVFGFGKTRVGNTTQ